MTQKLSLFFYRLTRNYKATVYLMAILFFPGTVIHELSHLLMAGILFVPVGHIDLFPRIEETHVKLGSVPIAHTDIFRRFLIGAAPFLFGTAILLGMLFYAATSNLFSNTLFTILLGYVAFEIGNTMFSSKKDMEGALELSAAIILFIILFYFLGIRLPTGTITQFFKNDIVLQIFQQGSFFLLIPIGINIIVLLLLSLFPLRKHS